MGALNDWDVTDANNNAAPPDGWPENTMAYSDVNDTGRAVQGTIKRFFADINGSLVGAGAADAYTVTLNESGYTAYFTGMIFKCSIPAANTVAAPTIDVNGIGATTIVDNAGNALNAGDLEAGGVYEFIYDGTDFRVSGGIGGAEPGGSDTEFQFNNAGLLDGLSTFTTDGTDLTLNGGDFTIEDLDSLYLGTGQDLRLFHNAVNSVIQNNNGSLLIQDLVTSGSLQIGVTDSGASLRTVIDCGGADATVTLRQGINDRLETTTDGLDLSGVVSFQDGFDETENTFTGAAGTKNLDVSAATYFRASSSMAGNAITFTFDNPPASGRVATITLELDGASTATITWPASVQWSNGSEPTWSAGTDIVSFITSDAGTTWYGFLGGLDFS